MQKISDLIYREKNDDFICIKFKSQNNFYNIILELNCNDKNPIKFEDLDNCFQLDSKDNEKSIIFDKNEVIINFFLNMDIGLPYEIKLMISSYLTEPPKIIKIRNYMYKKIKRIILKENFNICILKKRLNDKIFEELNSIEEIKIEEIDSSTFSIKTEFSFLS